MVLVRSGTRKVIGKLKSQDESKYPLVLHGHRRHKERHVRRDGDPAHTLNLETKVKSGRSENKAKLVHEQTTKGWMVVNDHDVINGSATTSQIYPVAVPADDRCRGWSGVQRQCELELHHPGRHECLLAWKEL